MVVSKEIKSYLNTWITSEEVKTVFDEVVVLNKPFMVPDLCIGCGICQAECPVLDDRAVYVTAVGESRSAERSLLLKKRSGSG